MLTTFTWSHDIWCQTSSRPPPKITTHDVYSLNKFFGQLDDGLHTGSKHVICILYIATNCNIFVFMTVCIDRYTHTTALYYWPNTMGMTHRKLCVLCHEDTNENLKFHSILSWNFFLEKFIRCHKGILYPK